jgi:predicted regulator of Ras-like GTPase activity (Roadblock/LC7/MglB family)
MDARQALAELIELSSQIEHAVVFDTRGELLASTLPEESGARSLAESGNALFALADRAGGEERGQPTQVGLTLLEGSVLLARQSDLRILALTTPDPFAELVLFDLRACLRKVAGEEPKRRQIFGRVIQAIGAQKAMKTTSGADSGSDRGEDGAA